MNKEFVEATFGKKESELSIEEKKALTTIESVTTELLKEFKKGVITEDAMNEKLKGMTEQLKEMSPDGKFGKAIAELEEFRTNLKNMSEAIESFKSKGFHLGGENTLEKQIDEIYDTQKFKDFKEGKSGKSSGKFRLELKGLISFGNSYTGDKLTTEQQNRVVSKIAEQKLDVRDVMTIDTIGQEFTSLTFTQITDLDRNAAFASENGRLSQSSFKMKEVSYDVKRVGTYTSISKRMLNSRSFVKTFLMNRLPKWVRQAENAQFLFGDGAGSNVLGITKHADVKCVSKIITDTVSTGEAGSVKEVSSYDGGKSTKIEFTGPHAEIYSGQKITLSGAITGTYDIVKMNDRNIIINKAYASVTTELIAALTFTIKNNFFNNVEDPNREDAVNAIFAVLTYAEYSPNAIVLDPAMVFSISTEKDTTGRSLNLVQRVNGVNYIGGRPIIEKAGMGEYYLAGDFANGAAITDCVGITLEMKEDVDDVLCNQTNIIIQEELIFPVYNPFAFAYGKLSDVVEAIKKP